MRTFSSAIHEFTVRDDGLLVANEINLDTPRTSQNVSETLDVLQQALGGSLIPGIWCAISMPEFPPTVWPVFVNRIGEALIALAILADEQVEKTLGAFPDVINSLLIPVRLFHTEDEAVEWLLQFVDAEPTRHL